MRKQLLKREDIIKAFGVKEFQKGLAYFVEGKIVSAMEVGGKLYGIVQGSMDRPYNVKINLEDLFASACSCPVECMCKHCAAVAIAYADGKISRFEDIKEKIANLTEDQAKSMLMRAAVRDTETAREIMRGPDACTWLGSRLTTIVDTLHGYDEVEELSEGCEKLRALIEGVESSDAPPQDIIQMCFAIAKEALDALDEFQQDPYEDLEGLILCTMELFEDAVERLPADTLEDALNTAMSLFGRDWVGIGLENMPVAFSSRLGADQILERFQKELRRKGPAAQGIKRISMRYLAYRAYMIADDINRAVEALLSDGASEDDMILAAQLWVLHDEWDKSRQVLESGIWMSKKRERAFLLLNTYVHLHQGSEAEIPSAQNIIRLLRSIDSDVVERQIDNILMLLCRAESDANLGNMIKREKLPARMKVQLFAKLRQWEAVEREVMKEKAWDSSDLWKLASTASPRPDISTKLALLALSRTREYVSHDYRPALAAALRNIGGEDLIALDGLNIIKLGIGPLIAKELASRFPEKTMSLLKGCLQDMDPQKLADVMSGLTDPCKAAELADAWLRWKLTESPRYDSIKAVLTVMRSILCEDDWNRIKGSLIEDFKGRPALKKAFDQVEIGAGFSGKIPSYMDDGISSSRRPERSRDY